MLEYSAQLKPQKRSVEFSCTVATLINKRAMTLWTCVDKENVGISSITLEL